MILSLLVAMDLQGGIGKDGRVPWHLGADLKLFKRVTMGHHILMGRKTFESIGRSLPGRENIVLTRDHDWSVSGVTVPRSLAAALDYAKKNGEKELFIIGGGDIFAQTVSIADRIYLSRVQTNADCTVHFPPLNPSDWVEIEIGYHPADVVNDHSFVFYRLERFR